MASKNQELPLTARDLQEGHHDAWQVFLAYAASAFPEIGPSAGEDFGLALEEGQLRRAVEEAARSTKEALQQMRDLKKGLPSALHAAPALRRSCEAQAMVSFRQLQLELLRTSKQAMLQALEEEVASSEQAGSVLCEIRALKEAAAERQLQRRRRSAEARRLLEDTEAALARLRSCQRRKALLLRGRKARICRAEEVTGTCVGLLVFRGRHRLRIQRCPGGQLGPESLCWLRFEACAPGMMDNAEEAPESWRRRFEEALCHLWIRQVDTSLAESKGSVLALKEVPDLLHRLQLGLLRAGDLLQAIASQRQLALGDKVRRRSCTPHVS
ncbi:unnamed protein product [Effrenium voratum]|uniref:Uncharacterized protein n=1 Tax=Effrenium voratum TaxID=2562239 RepID=A0AA36MNS4_9DINO|nr:unnamed protein product [Effrenium voratum]CAJ1374775.1 unnamed protein product [Effrenium voratum]CAJ1431852.1 unnamed protein product [Effrenium voratum]